MSKDLDWSNLRRNQRVPYKKEVLCEFLGKGKAQKGKAQDISMKGIQVFSPQAADRDDQLKLTIEHEGKKVTALATVRWVRPAKEVVEDCEYEHALGIEFMDMDEKYADVLAKVVLNAVLRPK